MNNSDVHRAMQWFAAGYLAADPDPVRDVQSREEAARTAAGTYVERYLDGDCLDCGRSGVVLMDGFFCERCHFPVAVAAPELFEGDQ